MKKILLVCGNGASSGFLAANMRKYSQKNDLDISVEAHSQTELADYIDDFDVVLVGPHLKFMLDDLKTIADSSNVPISTIDQMTYGTLDGGKAVQFALKLLEEK